MNAAIYQFETAARADWAGITVARIGLVFVQIWIGGLQAFRYEDEGIVPDANSHSVGGGCRVVAYQECPSHFQLQVTANLHSPTLETLS